MSITINELLTLDVLQGATLIAGERGGENLIEYVDVVEVPDIADWAKPGTLYMSTTYPFYHDLTKLKETIIRFSEANVSGMAIKLGRFLTELPEEIRNTAEELGFPIILLPTNAVNSPIITAIATSILEKRNQRFWISETFQHEINQIFLNGEGLEPIVHALAKALKRSVFVTKKDGQLLTYSANVEDEKKYWSLYRKIKEQVNGEEYKVLTIDGVGIALMPIMVSGKCHGRICTLVNEEEDIEFYQLVLQRAAALVALEIVREETLAENRFRAEAGLIEDILATDNENDLTILATKAENLGWNVDSKVVAILINIERKGNSNLSHQDFLELVNGIYYQVRQIIHGYLDQPMMLMKHENIYAFLNITENDKETERQYISEKINEIRDVLAKVHPNLYFSIGIGRTTQGIKNFSKTYQEAKQSVWIGKTAWGRGKVYHSHDLGVYKLLFSHKDTDGMVEFYHEYLHPLIEYDHKTGSELAVTISEYYKNDGNTLATAEKLFIHRNTLNYRLKRAGEVLGYDINDSENRLSISIALKIKELLSL